MSSLLSDLPSRKQGVAVVVTPALIAALGWLLWWHRHPAVFHPAAEIRSSWGRQPADAPGRVFGMTWVAPGDSGSAKLLAARPRVVETRPARRSRSGCARSAGKSTMERWVR